MLTKKNPFLIDEEKFEKVKKINDLNKLEAYLSRLLYLANLHYNAIYLKYKNNPNIEKFNFCIQNFSRIKSSIELKEKSLLNTSLYLEVWISMLYSEVHALNLEPETQGQFGELTRKINTIGTDFKQLLTKKSNLNSSNKIPVWLSNYIDTFEHTWKTKEKKLLADVNFNFAETLVENSDLENALNYFTKSMSLYKNAAKNAENELEKNQLLVSARQTNSRLEEVKKIISQNTLSKSKNVNDQVEKLTLHFKKLSDSTSKWTIVNEATSQSIKAAVEIKRKRKLNEEPFQFKAKKQKIESPTDSHTKIKIQWKTECTKLLNAFEQIGIEKYNLNDPFCKDELIRYKASLASKFAIETIEKLSFENKDLSDTEKLGCLKEAQNGFSKSIDFYEQIKLANKKEKIIQSSDLLATTIMKLETPINKIQAKPTKPQSKSRLTSSIKTQECQTLPTAPLSREKLLEIQPTFSGRILSKMYRAF